MACHWAEFVIDGQPRARQSSCRARAGALGRLVLGWLAGTAVAGGRVSVMSVIVFSSCLDIQRVGVITRRGVLLRSNLRVKFWRVQTQSTLHVCS